MIITTAPRWRRLRRHHSRHRHLCQATRGVSTMPGRVVRKEAKQNAVYLSLGHVLDNQFQLLGIPAVARQAAPRLPALLHGSRQAAVVHGQLHDGQLVPALPTGRGEDRKSGQLVPFPEGVAHCMLESRGDVVCSSACNVQTVSPATEACGGGGGASGESSGRYHTFATFAAEASCHGSEAKT